jgi:hypothetical protein
LLLIEDAAQAWLAALDRRSLGSFGDLAFFCLYKTFGLPDGSALLSYHPPQLAQTQPHSGIHQLGVRHAEWLMARSSWLAGLSSRRRQRHGTAEQGEDPFSLGDPHSPPSSATQFLLPRVIDDGAAARRRLHYQLLLDELAAYVPPPFNHVPDGASPFAFPIMVEQKEMVLVELARAGIIALNFWSVGHPALAAIQYPGTMARRSRTIGLPVHQELRLEDVEHIAKATCQALAGRRIESVMPEERRCFFI